MSYVRFIIILFSLITVLPASSYAADFRGKVVGVTDGDTIKVMRDGREVKISLHGVDCPEIGQPFGEQARQFTSGLTSGKFVTVKEKTGGKRGLIYADVILANEVSLNQQIVGAGLAWWYRKHAKYDRVLEDLEAKAKASKQGLWADPGPMSPWKWRKIKRQQKIKPKPKPPALTYSGNVRGRIFHLKGCRYYNCPACTVTFTSRGEAISLGYDPCNICNP